METTNSEKNSKRLNYPSGSKWEDIVGYSRVVKVGNFIEVAGTTATGEDGKIQGKDNPYLQTKFIIEKISRYLNLAGSTLGNVTRTRIFVKDIDKWEEIGRAHGEFFQHIKPVTSMVEVSRLIDPDILVEIEASAIIP